jgi:hypothetical protein
VKAKRKVAETDGKVTSGRDKRSETRRDSGERQRVNKHRGDRVLALARISPGIEWDLVLCHDGIGCSS